MESRLIVLFIVVFHINCACQDNIKLNFVRDSTISYSDGKSKQNIRSILPNYLFSKDFHKNYKEQYKLKCVYHMDSFGLNQINRALIKMDNNILYNYSFSNDYYRFTWVRSFHEPITISFTRKDDKGVFTIKKAIDLRRELQKRDPSTKILIRNDSIFQEIGGQLVLYKDRKDSIFISTLYTEISVLKEFNDLLNELDYYSCTVFDSISGIFDGSHWLLEANSENKYHVAYRFNPKESPFKEICLWLIKHSNIDLSEDEIY